MVVVVGVEVVFADAPPEPELPPLEPDDREVLGTTTVTVTLGVVLVTFVPDLPDVVPDFGFGVLAPGVEAPGW